ncbi:MAG: LamG domain-containing protein [Candidatus Hodarchaeales archaeon]
MAKARAKSFSLSATILIIIFITFISTYINSSIFRNSSNRSLSLGNSSEELILHLTFDEGFGNIVYDHSDKGNDGIIYDASWIEGIKGTALEFEQGNWVNCGNDTSFNIEIFTIEAWIYIYGTTGSWHQILSKYRTRNQVLDDAYILELWTDSQRLVLTLSQDGEPHWVACFASVRIEFNTWTFVTGTYDGSHIRLYINGVGVAASQVSIPVRKTSAPVVIGNHYEGNSNFNGRIDEIRMYNRVLTVEEIIADYNNVRIPNKKPLNVIGGFIILLMLVIILGLTIRGQKRKPFS